MGSKPAREDGAPSAGVNWKLLIIGIAIVALVAFALLPSGEEKSATVADLKADLGSNSGASHLETVAMPEKWASWMFEGKVYSEGKEIPLEAGKLYIGEGMGMFILNTRQGGATRFSHNGEEISLTISYYDVFPYREGTLERFGDSYIFLSDTVLKRENVIGQNDENVNYVCVMFEIA